MSKKVPTKFRRKPPGMTDRPAKPPEPVVQSLSDRLQEAMGNKLSQEINDLIKATLEVAPSGRPQDKVDALRTVLGVLSYHVGMVGRLIEMEFLASGQENHKEKVADQRRVMIRRGEEHAQMHWNEHSS